jgi:hypothetical protein
VHSFVLVSVSINIAASSLLRRSNVEIPAVDAIHGRTGFRHSNTAMDGSMCVKAMTHFIVLVQISVNAVQ